MQTNDDLNMGGTYLLELYYIIIPICRIYYEKTVLVYQLLNEMVRFKFKEIICFTRKRIVHHGWGTLLYYVASMVDNLIMIE